MKQVILTLLIAMSAQVFATSANLDGFNKRFSVVRAENGHVEAIKMKMFTKKFSLKPYINQVVNMVKEELQRRRENKSASNLEIDELISELRISTKSSDDQQAIDAIEKALKDFHKTDIENAMNTVMTRGVFAQYQKDLRDIFKKFSISTVANTDDSKYFYRRTIVYEVVTRALEFAKKKFSNIPVLNIASFIIVEVHNMILEQRLYHQNMLLHYLSNATAAELGMTEEEINHVYSSIFESRIGLTGYQESRNAQANWDFYGTDKYFTVLRGVNTRLRREAGTMSINARYNFGFVEVTEEGKRLVKNALVNKHMLTSKMSVAWDYEKPTKVKRMRSLMQLGELGLGFLPIPDMIKNLGHKFLKSMYVEQRRWEGALFGYFESNGNFVMAKKVHSQIMNPYLIL